jgi:hypothetical protein
MNIEQSAQQLSGQFGLDLGSLKCLLAFFERKTKEHITQGIDLEGMSEAEKAEYVRAGITAWNQQSQEFFAEVLANETERAQQVRADIAGQVYDEIKERQAH